MKDFIYFASFVYKALAIYKSFNPLQVIRPVFSSTSIAWS